MNGLTWYAVNNAVTLEDLPDLEVLGIRVQARSTRPMTVQRDPGTGRLLAAVGTVRAYRDGTITLTPRWDCPDSGVLVLARTGLDCAERDLHRRDAWCYYRASKRTPVGYWSARISVAVPEGRSVLSAHAAALEPVAATTGPQALHTIA
ncbi:hypothetical protein HMPREF3159_07990 [Brachybacterium sp. HMSC06H03]|uniref:hypothetical protein n=1 Tax=Brachybacterium sp. HMSC06H03 TaxID=1581127 RepID=UPI0008A36DFB|nr:hypothetical protein [Brachybacterium sp. HMSC06H03]OFT58156.1 hypothetical protein HMPREF3159_07990 [Brachybacterium sp. HMSC06H03]